MDRLWIGYELNGEGILAAEEECDGCKAKNDIHDKLEKLRLRIKNTSSVRFFAARRVKMNYRIAQLTVVILSLWAIVISYLLSNDLAKHLGMNIPFLTMVGVILPVFVVVFSLLENGEAFLRSHQLEFNARQLRELSDQLYTSAAVKGLNSDKLLQVYEDFARKYSDCLERTAVNHDHVDHLNSLYSRQYRSGKINIQTLFVIIKLIILWFKIQFKRVVYIIFWFAPAALFFFSPKMQ